jgi:carboxyl-terminal processing protease
MYRSTRLLSFLLAAACGAGWALPAEVTKQRLERLVRALSHPEFGERERAAEELIAIGPPALDAVRPLLRSEGGETLYRARRVFHAVRGFGPAAEEHIRSVCDTLKTKPLAEGGEALSAILEAGPAAVAFALELLGKAGGEHAGRFREELIVRKNLRDVREGRSWGGPEALRGTGAWGRKLLARAAADGNESPPLRLFALNALRQLAPDEVKETALALLRDAVSPVRQAAVLHLTELVKPEDFRLVARHEARIPGRSFLEGRTLTAQLAGELKLERLRGLLRDKDAAVRAAAAWALGFRRDEEARTSLASRLGDRAPAVRIEAARALGAIGTEEDAGVLGKRLGREKDPEVVAACLAALARLGEKAVPWLSIALRDEDAGVRRRAAKLLQRVKAKNAIHALIVTLGDDDPSVDAAALAAIVSLSDVELPPVLGVGTKKEREAAGRTVSRWWDGTREDLAKEQKLLGELAVEGGRVLKSIADILGEHFLSVKADPNDRTARDGSDKEKDTPPEVRTEELMKVARDAVHDLVSEKKISLASEIRGPLEALLARGAFRDLDDMGTFLGALPLAWERKDYVEVMNRVAKRIVSSLGDPFSRILVSHDAEGRFSKEIVPLLFGGSKTNGVIVRRSGDDVLVDFVLSASPGYRAGLQYGDQIVMIDGKPVAKQSRDELNEAINRKVSLTVFRQGWPRPFLFDLEPEEVFEREPVRFQVLPGKIGYLWLQFFGTGTDTRVEWALREMEKEGIRGLIFDVRNNPGGLVVACTNMIDKFLGESRKITTLKPRSGKENEQEIMSSASETDRDLPLVVLINRSSASASELLAGTLQDLKRAVLVGDRTYGKGIGQQGYTVTGFSDKTVLGESATFYLLSLTTIRYFFPSGGNPHGVGVTPDREVRPAGATGDRFARIYRLARSKDFRKYVESLAAEPGAAALACWDGADSARYPRFDTFYRKLKIAPSRRDVRRAVRRALRAALAAKQSDGECAVADLVDDRVLRAGLEELAEKLELGDLDELFERTLAPPEEKPAEKKADRKEREAKKEPEK